MTRVDIYFPKLMPSRTCFIYANDWVKRIEAKFPAPYPICIEHAHIDFDSISIYF